MPQTSAFLQMTTKIYKHAFRQTHVCVYHSIGGITHSRVCIYRKGHPFSGVIFICDQLHWCSLFYCNCMSCCRLPPAFNKAQVLIATN